MGAARMRAPGWQLFCGQGILGFIFLNVFLNYTDRERRSLMATPPRPMPQAKSTTAAVLLTAFPVALHREMRAEAARRGLYVTAAYAEACTMFLAIRDLQGSKRP